MSKKDRSHTKEQEDRYLILMKARLMRDHQRFIEAHPEYPDSIRNITFDDLTIDDILDAQEIKSLDELIQEVVDELNRG